MAIALSPLDSVMNLADLLGQLGSIPAHRVLFHPRPGEATEADVLRYLDAPQKRICELIDGVLVEKPMGYTESFLAMSLGALLNAFVVPRNLGIVTAADGTMRVRAGRVRIPDVAFASWDRMPGRRRPVEPIPDLAPDLAVEILSTSNTAEEMAAKRKDYFAAGVRLVWEIDPVARTVDIFTEPSGFVTLVESDVLRGDPVLPGFTLALGQFFAELDRHG